MAILPMGVGAGCPSTVAIVGCLLRGSFPVLAPVGWQGCWGLLGGVTSW